jgi:hypothetical protein
MSLTFKANGFQGVPVDVPFRLSDFLERGRPRPLSSPLMQTQPVLVWLRRRARSIRVLGLMVPQAESDHLHCRDPRSQQATGPLIV